MKINRLCLDVDGVIRIDKLEEHPIFDKSSLLNLKEICTKTNCKIVLTSDWQNDQSKLKNLKRVLKVLDLKIDDVAYGEYENRGKNILNYLKKHNCNNYIVIDDDIDIIKNEIDSNHYIITHCATGITDEIKNEVIKRLGDSYDLDYRICR